MSLPRNEYNERSQGRDAYGYVFVELMPEKLENGLLYICMRYATCAHNCFCGCGREVVTPLHPTKWQLSFDGINISLFPSIGNWSLPCRSHYWVRGGRISWADSWSPEEIEAARASDRAAQDHYFGETTPKPTVVNPAPARKPSRWRDLWPRRRKE